MGLDEVEMVFAILCLSGVSALLSGFFGIGGSSILGGMLGTYVGHSLSESILQVLFVAMVLGVLLLSVLNHHISSQSNIKRMARLFLSSCTRAKCTHFSIMWHWGWAYIIPNTQSNSSTG